MMRSPLPAQSQFERTPDQLRGKTLIEDSIASQSEFDRNPSGWTDLMPKLGFPGWTKVPIPAATPLNPKEQWSLHDGVLTIDGTGGHEWLRFDGKTFRNFLLRFEDRNRCPLSGSPSNSSRTSPKSLSKPFRMSVAPVAT